MLRRLLKPTTIHLLEIDRCCASWTFERWCAPCKPIIPSIYSQMNVVILLGNRGKKPLIIFYLTLSFLSHLFNYTIKYPSTFQYYWHLTLKAELVSIDGQVPCRLSDITGRDLSRVDLMSMVAGSDTPCATQWEEWKSKGQRMKYAVGREWKIQRGGMKKPMKRNEMPSGKEWNAQWQGMKCPVAGNEIASGQGMK